MRCEELSDDLAAAADGSVLLGRTERSHVERCLQCQAEMVQYRKVLRAMRAMRTEVLEPAPGGDGGKRGAVDRLRGGERRGAPRGEHGVDRVAGAGREIDCGELSRRVGW